MAFENDASAMLWAPDINWDTSAGRTLRSLVSELPKDREFGITLFGSSPLQLALEPTFVSADVDLFSADDAEVKTAVERAGLQKGQEDVYVQVCVESNFRTSPRWYSRAHRVRVGHVTLTLPHPIDILIAKLHRLDDKDLRAFRLVIDRTGHPTEEELREELQAAVDLFRPNFDEEMVGDITTNTRVLWDQLWGKDIDVRKEIIAPALARRREGYAADIPSRDYRSDLTRLAEEP